MHQVSSTSQATEQENSVVRNTYLTRPFCLSWAYFELVTPVCKVETKCYKTMAVEELAKVLRQLNLYVN